MLNDELNDDQISKMMKKSMLRMPSPDFDDKVMLRIHNQVQYKRAVVKNARLSCLFFIMGTALGLFINHLLPYSGYSLPGLSPEQILLYFQVGFIFFFLLQLDKIFRLIF